ncbi:hypothetical protein MTR67_018469 [Solanum verrucosum]|uniref:Uncharacterized protein n=1 Tax=Solanum verrucosum TaxID=315347 RepID=A0AAF0QS87_SOLVR|nr:hypothetical protein MTR67_018469 [Solanum verrucosum]
MNGKDEAIETSRKYKLKLKIIVMIRSDRCGEYESSFAEIYFDNRTIHQITCHDPTHWAIRARTYYQPSRRTPLSQPLEHAEIK